MKGTGALPLGRITVVSTGDLLPFLHIEGVNVYLSLFLLCSCAHAGRDNIMVAISFLIKFCLSWQYLAFVLLVTISSEFYSYYSATRNRLQIVLFSL